MGLFQLIAIVLTLTALISFINERYLHRHATIGVMLIALFLSLTLLTLNYFGVAINLTYMARSLLNRIEFDQALLQWMLGFLLFAGSLHVDLDELRRQLGLITLLATAGTVLSMFLVGGMGFVVFKWIGHPLPMLYCLLFGALISPTDPIAVLAMMKVAGAPKSTQTQLAGESLFNDGIGVVLFLTVLGMAAGNGKTAPGSVAWLLLREIGGGALIGLLAGVIADQVLQRIDHYQVEILLTLALAMGVYALAQSLHTSAPIAAVVSGILIGNTGRRSTFSHKTRENLDLFWELIDEILNAVLFMLIGFLALVIPFERGHWLPMLLVIPIVLFARWCSVAGAVAIVKRTRPLRRGTIPILTWGGLRGGLSLAMAMSLPVSAGRSVIVPITYGVVIFSIAVQGTTIQAVVRRCLREENDH